MNSLPPLNTLYCFNVAARTGSFVKAAEELFVTHGAVSRQIRLLEQSLGVKLFERRNRAVFLTPQGTLLQTTTGRIFAQLEKTLIHLRQPLANAPLAVSCEPTLLMQWLIPRLNDFHERHPEMRLHLFSGGGEVAFQRDRIDVALRRNDFFWDHSIHSQQVCDEWVAPVCVPSLLTHGTLTLSSQRLLHTLSRPKVWDQWSAATKIDISGNEVQSYQHFYLTLQAAGAAQGVAICSALMAHEEISSRRLVAPFGFVRDGSAYVLLSATPFEDDPRREAFSRWVQEQTAQTLRIVGVA